MQDTKCESLEASEQKIIKFAFGELRLTLSGFQLERLYRMGTCKVGTHIPVNVKFL